MIDILFLDAEGAEFEAIPLLKAANKIKPICQINIEIHHPFRTYGASHEKMLEVLNLILGNLDYLLMHISLCVFVLFCSHIKTPLSVCPSRPIDTTALRCSTTDTQSAEESSSINHCSICADRGSENAFFVHCWRITTAHYSRGHTEGGSRYGCRTTGGAFISTICICYKKSCVFALAHINALIAGVRVGDRRWSWHALALWKVAQSVVLAVNHLLLKHTRPALTIDELARLEGRVPVDLSVEEVTPGCF